MADQNLNNSDQSNVNNENNVNNEVNQGNGQIDRSSFLHNLASCFADNSVEPSTYFIHNLRTIYTFPKNDVIDTLFSSLSKEKLALLRERLYEIFIDEFQWSTLVEHGFELSNDHPYTSQLKRRGNPKYAATDIYDLGYSIFDNNIVSTLAKDIFKPAPGVNKSTPHQPILDSSTSLIIKKLDEVLKSNEKLTTENTELKKRITSLESTVRRLIHADPTLQTQASFQPQLPRQSYSDQPNTPNIRPQSSRQKVDQSDSTNVSEQTAHHLQQHQLELSCLMDIPVDPSIIETSQSSDFIGSTSNNRPHQESKDDNRKRAPTGFHNHKDPIFGDKKTSKPNITGLPKPFTLFVGGFNLKMTPQSTKIFIEKDIGLRVCDITSYRTNKYNQSFRIDINPSDKSKAFDPSTWVQGLIVKPFRHPKPQRYSMNRNHDYHAQYHDQNPADIPYHGNRLHRPPTLDNHYDIPFQQASPMNKHFNNYHHAQR